ncbi:MAG: hydroxymethylpyrimidine/phosphomethylpyrimidine kinase [Clostridia bacterium]|nr:hydroxymethylpyrimidine/phosphomethylpyrimidine kinase [Clostridia bacterium]
MKTVLTIAGSDPTSGAGIQSDLLTIYQNGVYPFSVVTSITSQNAKGVTARFDLDGNIVRSQLNTLLETHIPDAIKIGMLGSAQNCRVVYEVLMMRFPEERSRPPIILDPVMVSTGGKALMDDDGVDVLIEKLLPIVTLLTPNLMEFERIFAQKKSMDIHHPPCNILVKGGHSTGDCTDRLIMTTGETFLWTSPRIKASYDHGTGCTLSSAIAANLAVGRTLNESIRLAKLYLTEGIKHPVIFDSGFGGIRK